MFDTTVLTEMTAKIAGLDEHLYAAVSYTHLTLPTSDLV